MISPLGTLLTKVDEGLGSSVASLVGLLSQQIPGPLGVGCVLLFVIQGVQVANGDSRPLRQIVPWLVGFGFVFWLITNPTTYLYYVRDVVFTGIPSTLIAAVTGQGSSLMTPAGVGAVLDSLWAQVWDNTAMIGQTARLDMQGMVAVALGLLMAWANGVALAIVAAVYFVCRFFLTLVVIIGPLMIACWPFPAFRHYVWSWKGVGVSLMLAEILTFVTMQVALLACQPLMVQVRTALIMELAEPGAGPAPIQGMVAMGIILWCAAVAVAAVPMVTFFIGRGGSPPQPLIITPVRS